MSMSISVFLSLFLCLGVPDGQAEETTARLVADDAAQPQVAVGSAGKIYVVYIRNGNIEFSVSNDRGGTFSKPVTAMDAKGRASGGRQRGPRIALDREGVIYVTAPVCYDEREFKKPYPRAELWLVVSKDGGKFFSQPIRVNEVEKKASEALHWLAVTPSGEAYVAWIDDRTGEPAVFCKRISEQGKKLAPDQRVSQPVCPCCAPGLTVLQGNPIVVFREGGKKPSREIFAMRSGDGGRTFKQRIQVNRAPTLLPG